MVIANVFRKLETVNKFIRPLCENLRFGTRFVSQHVKVSQKQAKSPWNCENLQLPIQMQLSEKQKKFWQSFVPFLESTSNFKHFEMKDDGYS